MKKTVLNILMFSLVATAVALAPAQGLAQEKKEKSSEGQGAPKKKRDGLPLAGKIAAVDKAAKTVKIGDTVLQINDDTRITKAGKPGSLDDAAVGEEAGAFYKKDGEKNIALSLRIGPRPDNAGGGEKKKKKE